jgi:putative membrane protein
MRWLVALLLLSLGCWLTGISSAADDKKEGKDEGGSAKTFAKKASAAGLAEVNLSQLAIRFSRDPGVRQFAQRMIDNHARANEELTRLANRKSIVLAERMD